MECRTSSFWNFRPPGVTCPRKRPACGRLNNPSSFSITNLGLFPRQKRGVRGGVEQQAHFGGGGKRARLQKVAVFGFAALPERHPRKYERPQGRGRRPCAAPECPRARAVRRTRPCSAVCCASDSSKSSRKTAKSRSFPYSFPSIERPPFPVCLFIVPQLGEVFWLFARICAELWRIPRKFMRKNGNSGGISCKNFVFPHADACPGPERML